MQISILLKIYDWALNIYGYYYSEHGLNASDYTS